LIWIRRGRRRGKQPALLRAGCLLVMRVFFLFTDVMVRHSNTTRHLGNPAVSSREIRGFPTPPRDGCGFIWLSVYGLESRVSTALVNVPHRYIIRRPGKKVKFFHGKMYLFFSSFLCKIKKLNSISKKEKDIFDRNLLIT
jgi:hypothetical protein